MIISFSVLTVFETCTALCEALLGSFILRETSGSPSDRIMALRESGY